ncbi:hypothetical protein CEUSTIGMA_g6035.t1 [Chlamydomonas eustigma]|uniref:FAD-binding PCMH-type domain-containing protein n=1 Tax=Chlamydomonas eustigma TaxID=1157962 RepID=A0A250X6C0_9CHLO|nr:hypothetical protein CEUSTIGMA_g6035.t1 [Chlamydomonas eustigma]|eukprot:GAX78596.1 hypothetical protein CEUSTIGMA_g6035.t1 [Chlamydomonas eustigma]
MQTIDLLRYLGNYVTQLSPTGYTLPAFPWFVYQTIGGAVSTGSHGSSLAWGSLSNQLLGVTMVLANGTLRTFTPETDPFLMRAVRVAVGQLGIITNLRFRLIKEQPVQRFLQSLSSSSFLKLMETAQQQYTSNQTMPSWLNETEFFWITQDSEFLMVSCTRGDVSSPETRHEVLASFNMPDNTTMYNTSWQLLQDPVLNCLDALPLNHSAHFGPDGLGALAQDYTGALLNTFINAPLPQLIISTYSNNSATLKAGQAVEAAEVLKPLVAELSFHEGSDGHERRRSLQKLHDQQLTVKNRRLFQTSAATARQRVMQADSDDGDASHSATENATGGYFEHDHGGITNASNGDPYAGLLSMDEAVALGNNWDIPPKKDALAYYAAPNMAEALISISRAGVLSIASNNTPEAHESYLYQPDALLDNIRTVRYDQYEVAVPVSTMGDCFKGLLDMVYEGDIDSLNETQKAKVKGFRTAPLIRVLGQEDGLLAYTGDVPRIFVNVEDYIFYNAGEQINTAFKAVMAHLRSSPACGNTGLEGAGGRLHWGKAGWPDAGCWHGDKEYPHTWCDFGCAKMYLDPTNKFADSAPDRWTWEGVDLASCCSMDKGFLREKAGCSCNVKHERNVSSCPPSPYYTNR